MVGLKAEPRYGGGGPTRERDYVLFGAQIGLLLGAHHGIPQVPLEETDIAGG